MGTEESREGVKRLATCERRASEELRIDLREYRGHPFVEVRLWFLPADADEKAPTKKGVTIKPHELPAVVEALTTAARELQVDGDIAAPVRKRGRPRKTKEAVA